MDNKEGANNLGKGVNNDGILLADTSRYVTGKIFGIVLNEDGSVLGDSGARYISKVCVYR